MFSYTKQVAKFGKQIVALEDVEESSILVGRCKFRRLSGKKTSEWLQKKTSTERTMLQLVQDAYRERNIDLLDSIVRAYMTEHYLRNML